MNKKAFRKISELTGEFFGRSDNLAAVLQIKKIWHELAGEMIAKISYPFRYKAGVLHIALRDSAWMAEMPYIKPILTDKLKKIGIEIKDIKFSLSKIAEKKENPPEEISELNEKDKIFAEKISSLVEKNDARNAFYKALSAFLCRKERG